MQHHHLAERRRRTQVSETGQPMNQAIFQPLALPQPSALHAKPLSLPGRDDACPECRGSNLTCYFAQTDRAVATAGARAKHADQMRRNRWLSYSATSAGTRPKPK
jgi:hypothetical protein